MQYHRPTSSEARSNCSDRGANAGVGVDVNDPCKVKFGHIVRIPPGGDRWRWQIEETQWPADRSAAWRPVKTYTHAGEGETYTLHGESASSSSSPTPSPSSWNRIRKTHTCPTPCWAQTNLWSADGRNFLCTTMYSVAVCRIIVTEIPHYFAQ